MDKTNDETDAFTQALNAVERWARKSVYYLEQLAADADTAFKRMSDDVRADYHIEEQWEIDAMITNAIEAAGQLKFSEAVDNFEIPDHPTLVTVDVDGDTLYFSEEFSDSLVHVSEPLEPRSTGHAR